MPQRVASGAVEGQTTLNPRVPSARPRQKNVASSVVVDVVLLPSLIAVVVLAIQPFCQSSQFVAVCGARPRVQSVCCSSPPLTPFPRGRGGTHTLPGRMSHCVCCDGTARLHACATPLPLKRRGAFVVRRSYVIALRASSGFCRGLLVEKLIGSWDYEAYIYIFLFPPMTVDEK